MLSIIVAIYCIVDDLLEASHHTEDCRRIMSDAEVITTRLGRLRDRSDEKSSI
jgi:hypothetical protein